jgi:alpha-D-ribose 1-methylphosphonate 5-triphosphate synthase subunit PhnI
MGYTTVANRSGAVAAAAELAAVSLGGAEGPQIRQRLPLLVDQVMAEAGVIEPDVAARALEQARGDIARAVSLVRAWAAVLPRLARAAVDPAEMRLTRRITPAYVDPPGGQYLGASLDYAHRLLELDGHEPRNGHRPIDQALEAAPPHRAVPPRMAPETLPSGIGPLSDEGVLATPSPRANAADVTREPVTHSERGALLQHLCRAETGAITALAYSAIRGYGQRQDPTIVELRSGMVDVRVPRPGGGTVTVGEVELTTVEVVVYRLHDTGADTCFTLGYGLTPGRIERRAIGAAILDAGCSRAVVDPPANRPPAEDAEFLSIVLDGQEATGFVEHLKLPHHVTFTSDVDQIRAAAREEDV